MAVPNVYTPPAQRGFDPGAGPLLGNGNGVTLRSVDPNELASTRLETLLRSDNPILQDARQRASTAAAARGAGVDGGSWAYNAEQGMASQLTPLASEEAAQYGHVYDANQEALNAMAQQREQTRGTLRAAQIGAASALDQLRMRNQYDTEQRAQQREWDLADQDTQARASARSQFFGNMEQAIFSDPSFWTDPEGAMGAFDLYSQNFDTMFQNAFPEYYDTEGTP